MRGKRECPEGAGAPRSLAPQTGPESCAPRPGPGRGAGSDKFVLGDLGARRVEEVRPLRLGIYDLLGREQGRDKKPSISYLFKVLCSQGGFDVEEGGAKGPRTSC